VHGILRGLGGYPPVRRIGGAATITNGFDGGLTTSFPRGNMGVLSVDRE
jgi:hypothetical protein